MQVQPKVVPNVVRIQVSGHGGTIERSETGQVAELLGQMYHRMLVKIVQRYACLFVAEGKTRFIGAEHRLVQVSLRGQKTVGRVGPRARNVCAVASEFAARVDENRFVTVK